MTLKLEPLVLVYAGYAGYPGPHRGVAFRVDINTPGILLAGSTQECAPLHSKKVQVRSQSVIQDSREGEGEREREREREKEREREREGGREGETETETETHTHTERIPTFILASAISKVTATFVAAQALDILQPC